MESQYEYIGFVGCYTKEGQADPFEGSHGGVPHDRSKIGTGVLAITVNASSGNLSFLNDGEPIIKADEVPNPSYLCILERGGSSDSFSNNSNSNNSFSNNSNSSNRPAALQNGGLCIVSELEKGTFHSFAIRRDDETTMKITAKSAGKPLETGGSYPCHIIRADVGSDTECILVCNYGEEEGVLSAFAAAAAAAADDDDSKYYTRQIRIPFGPGSNADPERQRSSHAHSACIVMPPFPYSMMDLCIADLGSDAIVQYSMNTTVSITDDDDDDDDDDEVPTTTTTTTTTTTSSSSTTLQCIEKRRLAAPPGSGPRSLMFNPAIRNIAIVSLEMTAQVWLIQRLKDGSFEGCGDPISILPERWPDDDDEESSAKENKQFNGGRWASDAVWSPDGKYVYAAARLHNSISVFRYVASSSKSVEGGSGGGDGGGGGDDGGGGEGRHSLELVQRVPTEGLTPRCLCMSECGRILLVAHQHSHDVSSFRREGGDGTIVFADRLEVPNAACVKLVRPELIG